MPESAERILTNNLLRQFQLHQEEYEAKALEVLRSGWYILGKEVSAFEREWAEYIGTKECVGVGNGLDALRIAFHLLGVGPGDEVIVSANAYIACVMGITLNGGTPVFVEPDEFHNIDAQRIEEKITPRTKAILAVHLFGQTCDMDTILALAQKHSLKVVEDCAQSHGNHWKGQRAGSIGDIGCFSFYPSKGCGAFGDAGCITTNDPEIARNARVYRNYGSEKRYYNETVGLNSRLDELQAGLLRVKLTHLEELNAQRVQIAQRYLEQLKNPLVTLPQVRPGADCVWHQFVIRIVPCERREAFMAYLKERGIDTLIHYPIPPHRSRAYAYLGYGEESFPVAEQEAREVVSLPIYNGMTPEEQERVIDAVNSFR